MPVLAPPETAFAAPLPEALRVYELDPAGPELKLDDFIDDFRRWEQEAGRRNMPEQIIVPGYSCEPLTSRDLPGSVQPKSAATAETHAVALAARVEAKVHQEVGKLILSGGP